MVTSFSHDFNPIPSTEWKFRVHHFTIADTFGRCAGACGVHWWRKEIVLDCFLDTRCKSVGSKRDCLTHASTKWASRSLGGRSDWVGGKKPACNEGQNHDQVYEWSSHPHFSMR